ncbi:MAG: ATP-binding protein [Desulfatibacillaceae bacterium]
MTQERDTPTFISARSSRRTLAETAGQLASEPLLEHVVQAVPSMLVVLNENREIVFANESFLKAVGGEGNSGPLGMRPGEALMCEHAAASEHGCGTSEFCRHCGAHVAIQLSTLGERQVSECRISRLERKEPLDLRVTATPVSISGRSYTIFAAEDISHEKRRRALERIFFHDIMNTAGGLVTLSDLFRTAGQDKLDMYKGMLAEISEDLVAEIQAQRDLLAAENNELAVRPTRMSALGMLQSLIDAYERRDIAQGRRITVDPGARDVELFTDRVLLGRVLGNMLKNAVEASRKGDEVVLGCSASDENATLWAHNPTHMPRDVQRQVFNRSFSTKGMGRGLGTYGMRLLTECYLQGRVSFESNEEDGTTFFVTLPLSLGKTD